MPDQVFILPAGKAALAAFLDRLPMKQRWKVTVALFKHTRSNAQNNALWGVAYPAIRVATGNDLHDLHDLFCGEYYGWVETVVLSKRRMKPRRTTTTNELGKRDVISTADFSDFYLAVQMKAAEFGIDVPAPNE